MKKNKKIKITDQLKEYFKTHTKEEVLKDWEETKNWDNINSPTIKEFINKNKQTNNKNQ